MMNRHAATPSGAIDPDERHPERPRPVRLLHAQHQHAGADQREREQRPDVGQIVGLGRVADQRRQRDDDAGHQRRRRTGCASSDRPARPTAAAARRAPSRRRCAAGRTGTPAAPRPSTPPRRAPRSSRRRCSPASSSARASGSATAELVYGTMPGQHDADDDVDHRADGQPAEDADRQVALRVLRLLGGRRDRVEADVGKEHDRRALVDAGEAVRRERRVVGRVDVRQADADEQRQRQQLDRPP